MILLTPKEQENYLERVMQECLLDFVKFRESEPKDAFIAEVKNRIQNWFINNSIAIEKLIIREKESLQEKQDKVEQPKRKVSEEESKEVAKEIIAQIKSLDKWAFGSWGVKNVVASDKKCGGVVLGVKGSKILTGGKLEIILNSMDTYDITLYRLRGATLKTVKTVEGIYCESLVEVINDLVG